MYNRLPESTKERIRELMPHLIDTVCESVHFASTKDLSTASDEKPYGEAISGALSHAMKTAGDMGFSTYINDNQVGWLEYGEGDEMVAVLGHLDVVPAGDGWDAGPFDAVIKDGCIWGRGTMDDKGPMFACLYALKALADTAVPLRRRVRILFGTDEESGSGDIPHYAASEEKPVMAFSPDGEFPVIFAEKGIVNLDVCFSLMDKEESVKLLELAGGTASNAVPSECTALLETESAASLAELMNDICLKKGYAYSVIQESECLVRLTVRGKSAHGSTPDKGINAISRLMSVLSSLPLSGSVKKAAVFLAEKIGDESDGTSLGIAMRDDITALTVNLGTIKKEKDSLHAVLNIRYPVTAIEADVLSAFDCCCRTYNIDETPGEMTYQALMHLAPLYFPKDAPIIETLMSVYRHYRAEGDPIAIGGGTYAKELPNTVAFGPMFPGREDRNHQANEYISLDELEELTMVYAEAIAAMANA